MLPTAGVPAKDVAPFLKSLRQMLENEPRDVLRWTADGRAFEIHDMERMMASVLPKYFKHCKYTSFQRQLNYFNFRKWTKSKAVVCTFSNDFFLRDQPELAWRITRKKSSPSAAASAAFHQLQHQLQQHPHPHQIHHHHHPYRRPHPAAALGISAKRQDALAASPTTHAAAAAVYAPPAFWRTRAPSASAGFSEPDYRQQRRFLPPGAALSPLTISAGPDPSPEPLDWMIDCLLPPPERADDGAYGCYMYGAGPLGGAMGSGGGAAAGPDPAANKFEYVVM